MSSGNKDDLSNTRSMAKGAIPTVSRGKTWLGHIENRQSGLIDLLILEGIYSVREIAVKVESAFPGVTDSAKRVEHHIDHLQTGKSADGLQEPHRLKMVTDAAGKIRFDIN
jgi:hypothetical protein